MLCIRKLVLLSLCATVLYGAPVRAAESKAAAPETASTAQKTEFWSKRCQDIKDPKDAKKVTGKYCEIFQRLAYLSKDGKSQQRAAEVAIGYPPGEKTAKAVIILPLGVMVQETMSILIDEKNENHFHVQYCLTDGCYATLNLPAQILETMGAGKQLSMKGKTMAGQPLQIIMSLTGFSKAAAEIRPN